MKNISFDRKMVGALLVVLFIHVLLAYTAFGPMITGEMKEMPIGFLNEDKGAGDENMGLAMEQKLLNGGGKEVQWIQYNSRQAMEKAFDTKEIYGGLALPEDLTRSIHSIHGEEAQSAMVEIFINQGMNAMAANAAQGILSGVVQAMNGEIRNGIITTAGEMGLQFQPEQVQVLSQPLGMQINVVNAVGGQAQGQLPLLFTVLLWLGSLIGSLMIWLMLHTKEQYASRFMGTQLVSGIILAVVQSLWVLIVARWFMGLELVNYGQLILTLIIIAFCFYLIQSSVLNWLGFKGWPLLILVWLFGPPIVSMPPELLSSFYQWVYGWVPFRFSLESFNSILFFDNGGNLASMLGTILAIGGLFLALFLASYYRLQKGDLQMNPMAKRFKSA